MNLSHEWLKAFVPHALSAEQVRDLLTAHVATVEGFERLRADLRKLEQNLGGVGSMERLPAAIFVVDPRKEAIVVKEARKLKIPIIGVVDTNCDPDEVDFVIPGNDDALRAIRLFTSRIADAVLAGRTRRESVPAEPAPVADGGGQGEAPKARQARPARAEQAAPASV